MSQAFVAMLVHVYKATLESSQNAQRVRYKITY